jgi:hypothetical protein
VSDTREDAGAAERPRSTPDQQPGSGSSYVTDRLFEWETRHFSPARRAVTRWWRRNRDRTMGLGFAMMLFVLGAAVAVDPEQAARVIDGTDLLSAEDQLRTSLDARDGEIQLLKLELNRLQAIVDHSRHNRIPADLAAAIYDIAVTEGIDPALAFSLVRVESAFTRRAVSSAGAVGFTQVMPSTAFWLQPGVTYGELFERDTNLRLGFRYLKLMLEQYSGDMHLALLAYNRGPGKVDNILRVGGDPSNGYSRLVRTGMLRSPSE